MSAVTPLFPEVDLNERVESLIREKLAPQTVAIDREGVYPAAFMRELGATGGYSQHLASQRGDGRSDVNSAVEVISAVSRECMSTGFCAWCQSALAWYLEHADDPAVRGEHLPTIASGEQLGGTGLSNGMKNVADIEPLKIRVKKVEGGYLANGTLPWVSNLGDDHTFAAIFEEVDSGARVMAMVFCNQPGFSLQQCAEFVALEGSATYACHFKDCFIPDNQVISARLPSLIPRIRGGFVLMQMGMGLGVIQSCIDIMETMRQTQGHVNCYLDEQPEALAEELEDARQATALLAADVHDTSDAYFSDVLQLRHGASELVLKASQAAMLHAGARGYLADAPAQRKLREAYFVAIVTPAIKHLRKEIERLQAA